MAASVPPNTTSAAVGCHRARAGAPSSVCASRTTAIAAGTPMSVAYSRREAGRLLILDAGHSDTSRGGQRTGDHDDAPKFRFVEPVVHVNGNAPHEHQVVVRIDGYANFRMPQAWRRGDAERRKTIGVTPDPRRDVFAVRGVAGEGRRTHQRIDGDPFDRA